MLAALKSELLKLKTIRSTYVTALIALLIVLISAVYVEGLRGISGSPASLVTDKALYEIFLNSAGTASILAAVMAILFVVHEYRYNTIMHTLTATSSRTKAFFAKIIALLIYVAIFTLVCGMVGLLGYAVGLAFRDGVHLPPQDFNWMAAFIRAYLSNLFFVFLGFWLGMLTRNIAASIAIFLMIPSTVEPLITLVWRAAGPYLPFPIVDRAMATTSANGISPGKAIIIATAYIVGFGIVNWVLFLRRDAN